MRCIFGLLPVFFFLNRCGVALFQQKSLTVQKISFFSVQSVRNELYFIPNEGYVH